MPQLRYRTDTPAGRIIVDGLDAPSRDEVVRRIEYLEHLTIEAKISRIRCYGRL
jgi:general secretion pathway protein F